MSKPRSSNLFKVKQQVSDKFESSPTQVSSQFQSIQCVSTWRLFCYFMAVLPRRLTQAGWIPVGNLCLPVHLLVSICMYHTVSRGKMGISSQKRFNRGNRELQKRPSTQEACRKSALPHLPPHCTSRICRSPCGLGFCQRT